MGYTNHHQAICTKQMLDILFTNVKMDLNSVFDFGESASLLREYVVGTTDNFVSSYQKLEKKISRAVEDMIEAFSNIES